MSTVRIRYCRVWNYRPRAARVAAALKRDLGVDAELVEGKRSEFTVWVGDDQVAAKSTSGFPSDEDVVARVRAALGPS